MTSHSPTPPHATGDNNDPNYNEHVDFVDSCRDIEMNSEIEADVQGIMYLEHDLHNLRSQRMEELHQRIYIAPMAKPSLQAQDDDLFPLMEKGQEFLASEREVMLILGDSGAGKSTFNRHLEYQLWTNYEQGGPIPLYANLPLMDNPAQTLIEKLLEHHNFSLVQIQEMKLHRQFVLICDGYDESQLKVNIHTTNKFNQSGQWRVKVVISCRTQYLGQDYRSCFQPQPVDRHHATRSDLFQEAVIAPFSKQQIEEYVARYVPLECRPWVAEDYMRIFTTIPSLMDLVKNPFLLMLSLEVLPAIIEDKQDLTTVKVTRVQLYDTFVVHWLEVNQRRLESNALSMDDRNVFDQLLDAGFTSMGIDYSTRLALAIFDRQDGRPVVQYKDLHDSDSWKEEFFGPEPVTRLLQESSPLTRSGDQFRFLHRSILEYFFSRVIYSPVVDTETVTESLVAHSLHPSNPLFRRNLLSEPSIIQFLCDRVKLDSTFNQQLHSIIYRSKTDATVTVAATNAITILVRSDVSFHGADLRGVKIPGADLSDGQFDSAQFQEADLSKVNLSRSWLRHADLSSALIEGALFGELPYLEIGNFIEACAYSPDGRMLAVGGVESNVGCISIYETSFWTEICRIGCAAEVRDVAFSPNGQIVMSGGKDGMVRLWDCTNGQEIFVMEGHSDWTTSVAFSPCGKQIASASHDRTVRLWDSQTGKNLFILEGHTDFISSIRYSPKGERLVSGGWDTTIRFWDTVTGEPGMVLRSSLEDVFCLGYSPDGQWIVSGHFNNELQLWNTANGEPGPVLRGHIHVVNDVAFSPNGQWLASSSHDKSVRLWDASTGTLVSKLSGHGSEVTCVAFSPDGHQIASGGYDKKMRLWETNLSSSSLEAQYHFGPVWTTMYSPDGESILSRSDQKTIRQWDSLTGVPGSLSFKFPESLSVMSTVLSPDGGRIATCLMGGSIQLWDLQTGAAGSILEEYSGTVLSMAFSPCSRRLVFCDYSMALWLWDIDNAKQPRVLFKLESLVYLVAVSPNGCQIALCCVNKTVHLLDPPSGELLSSITLEDGLVKAMAFSPTGPQLALAFSDYSVKLWNLRSDKPGVGLKGHINGIDSVAYSPCGQWIASGSQDKSVRLWHRQQQHSSEAESWSCVYSVHGFFHNINTVAWNPVVPMEFVTGCSDGSVRVWRVSSEGGRTVVRMLWGSKLRRLCVSKLSFKDATGLSPIQRRLLLQRGAVDSISNPSSIVGQGGVADGYC